MARNPPMPQSTSNTWEWPAAVIMERKVIVNRWETCAIVRDTDVKGAPARDIVQTDKLTQTLYPGHLIRLHRDEAEGYYYNITSPAPKVLAALFQASMFLPGDLTLGRRYGSGAAYWCWVLLSALPDSFSISRISRRDARPCNWPM